MDAIPNRKLCADQRLEKAEEQWRSDIIRHQRGPISFIEDDNASAKESLAGYERIKCENDQLKRNVAGDALTREQLQCLASPGNIYKHILERVDLRGANLWGVDFHGFDLSKSKLPGAMLCKAKFGSEDPVRV